MPMCACGCGKQTISETARFLPGHHRRLVGRNPARDLTGMPCIRCGVELSEDTHSNRSKLTGNAKDGRRAWRICRFCLSSEKAKSRDRQKDREANRAYRVSNWEKVLITACKRRAKDSKVPFSISADDIRKLYAQQEGRCYWFGVPLEPTVDRKNLFKPSVDRLQTELGYVVDNIVLTSYFANIGRRNTDPETWGDAVESIKIALTVTDE